MESLLDKIKNTRRILLSLLAVLGIALIGTVPFLVDSIEQKNVLVTNLQTIQKSSKDIIYFDEVLTMSARMYAYSKQPEWLTRYFAHAEKLDKTLALAKMLDPKIKEAIIATSDANDQLIAIETASFDLVKSDKLDTAREILLNQRYEDLKLAYQQNIYLALKNAQINTEKAILTLEKERTQSFSIMLLILSISFIAVCLFTYRHSRISDATIRSLIESLDNKIKELNQSNVRLRKADSAKDAFLANVSHELRTPMNGICGSLQLLKEVSLDPNAIQLINTALRSTDILIGIVNEILDLSKIRAGKLAFESRSFNLPELVDDIDALFKKECCDKGLVFELKQHIHHEYWQGDPLRIKQVLLNVLNNAVKFTHQGKITLTVNANKEQNSIAITVTDTGIGMDASELSKLFEVFEQADPSTTREYGGTGLGMTIVKSLVEGMGGSIDVASEKDKGTIVYLTLALTSIAESKAFEECKTPCERLSLSVLVAEDNKINQVIIKNMLELLACKVTLANNGKEALKLLNDSIDVILMDIQMPIMDGIEACRQVKAQNPHFPVIALTANVLPSDIEKYKATGFDCTLSKPLKKSSLCAALKANVATVINH